MPNAVNKVVAGRSKQQYNEDNRETILQHKHQYGEANRQALQQYKQRYQEANREAISERKNTKHTCDVCGGKYTRANKARHLRSNTHNDAVSPTEASSMSSGVESSVDPNPEDSDFDQ